MTATATRTATFTITDARYVGAKVGADLRLLNILYGRPSLESIAEVPLLQLPHLQRGFPRPHGGAAGRGP